MTPEFLTYCINDLGAIFSMLLGALTCGVMVWGFGRG